MDRMEWISTLRELHTKSRRGVLSVDEQAFYDAARDGIARAILGAKRVTVPPGGVARDYLFVHHAAQVDLHLAGGRLGTLTGEIGVRGFVVRLPSTGVPQAPVRAALRVPGGKSVEATVHVEAAQRAASHAEVTFRFDVLASTDREMLSFAVFDVVLAGLLSPPLTAVRA